MELYHKDIRLPAGFRLPKRTVGLAWTAHAIRACGNDRYGRIPRVPILNLATCEVIEVGITGRKVEKVVVRTEFDDELDIVFVLIPNGDTWPVKTVWYNMRTDQHRTLDRSKYVC